MGGGGGLKAAAYSSFLFDLKSVCSEGGREVIFMSLHQLHLADSGAELHLEAISFHNKAIARVSN